MPRGRPPKPIALHKLQGTFRPDRHAARPRAGAGEGSGIPDGLTKGQQILLRVRPKGLPWHQARRYRELVEGAPWLTAIDRDLLLSYLDTWHNYTLARGELGARHDPRFADAGSDTAKEGMALSRVVARQAQLLITLAHALGFTPAARRSLGISTSRPRSSDDASNPWHALRLVESGRDSS